MKIPDEQVIAQRNNSFIEQITFMSKNIGLHSYLFDPSKFQIAKKKKSKCSHTQLYDNSIVGKTSSTANSTVEIFICY